MKYNPFMCPVCPAIIRLPLTPTREKMGCATGHALLLYKGGAGWRPVRFYFAKWAGNFPRQTLPVEWRVKYKKCFAKSVLRLRGEHSQFAIQYFIVYGYYTGCTQRVMHNRLYVHMHTLQILTCSKNCVLKQVFCGKCLSSRFFIVPSWANVDH